MSHRWFTRVSWMVVIVSLVLPGGTVAGDTSSFPGPDGLIWDIQLIEIALNELPGVDVVEIDGFDATTDDVATLHAAGITAVCYINAGAWEAWRPDASDYPDEIIGEAYPGWEGERFVDVRQVDLLGPILAARLDLCVEKGFDAVDPDNVDTYLTDTGFPLTESDQLAFNRWLATEAHARGLAIGQKNVPELAPDLVDAFDFAVTEDCLVDGWCDDMTPYADAGKPVLMIEYTDRDLSPVDLCGLAAGTFGSVVIKHRDLNAWSAHCP